MYALDELGTQLRRHGAYVGMDTADRCGGLTDDGNGLEDFRHEQVPRAEWILDCYHAAEPVNAWAKAWCRQEDAASGLAPTWCQQRK